MDFKRERGITRFALVYNKKFTLKLQKSRTPQVQDLAPGGEMWNYPVGTCRDL